MLLCHGSPGKRTQDLRKEVALEDCQHYKWETKTRLGWQEAAPCRKKQWTRNQENLVLVPANEGMTRAGHLIVLSFHTVTPQNMSELNYLISKSRVTDGQIKQQTDQHFHTYKNHSSGIALTRSQWQTTGHGTEGRSARHFQGHAQRLSHTYLAQVRSKELCYGSNSLSWYSFITLSFLTHSFSAFPRFSKCLHLIQK